MAAPVKYLFETEFGQEAKRAAEPRITLAEHQQLVAQARQEGHAAGFAAGEAKAMAAIERQRALALGQLGDRLAGAAAALSGLEGRLEAEAIDIAVAVARKLSDALVAREPLDAVRDLVADCFANLRSAPHLVVRVNDDLLEDARTELTKLAAERGFDGRLVIMAEPAIALGDCRIEWSSGGIMLDREETARRIAEAVGRYIASTSGTPEALS
ncbi:FliH/SctL family protein [Phreatobacter cathodiphilus]|uniref:Flagellar assembly protein H n=1 Tax=Phreatobacter cathodiphilus TaxID=1868589 RepID=A0A2S0NI60_9HYPH|nr:FliH/SctL family protein [Phreatobacter cathodiphilus]AVO47651.1 flagellar assembly protein H [Phreatobacter cathodiphilus]